MATPGKANKETKRQTPAKASLDTPYQTKWKAIPQGDMCAIQRALGHRLESMGLQKIESKKYRKFKGRKQKKLSAPQECVAGESHDADADPPRESSPKSGWTDTCARRQLAVGINEVTKALERNQLRLVLVCKSAKPQHTTDHLIALSASRETPACQLSRLSGIVSEPLRLKSVLALGFRHCSPTEEDHFSELVGDIIPRVPPLRVAWLHGTGEELMESSDQRGKKRKLEDEVRDVDECDVGQTEAPEAVPCTLQPLQVKKVTPNPNKSRRRKKNRTV